jgi:hypothetical protein
VGYIARGVSWLLLAEYLFLKDERDFADLSMEAEFAAEPCLDFTISIYRSILESLQTGVCNSAEKHY